MTYYIVGMILIFVLFTVISLFIVKKETKNNTHHIDLEHVNQNSFQNYAKFYGEIYPRDEKFDQKLNTIYSLIVDSGVRDIKTISDSTSCALPECVLKIKYLKNKRLIGDLYIDTVNMKLIPCSEEDQVLLEKYKPFIYGSHSQVSYMASVLPNPQAIPLKEFQEEILREIKSLDQKGLLNGIKIDDIDGEIIYYTIEKRKVFSDYETVHCPNCGALNDVDVTSKVRCSYCQTIIKGKDLDTNNLDKFVEK